MKVVIQKIDLDTCLTAVILGVRETDEIVVTRGDAPLGDLQDSRVICIEAGGSGMASLSNYDHHLPGHYLPPACRQAMERQPLTDERTSRLVNYVCMVDEAKAILPPIPFPTLSSLFSGMLLTEKNTIHQFLSGLTICRKVLSDGFDPFATMPDLPEWRPFIAAKQANQQKVEHILESARYYISEQGMKIGYLESGAIGGIGTLYGQGCQIAILFNPAFGDPPVRKFTIAGNHSSVDHLLPILEKMEQGWGGRQTIIGSPRTGSTLSVENVLNAVIHHT